MAHQPRLVFALARWQTAGHVPRSNVLRYRPTARQRALVDLQFRERQRIRHVRQCSAPSCLVSPRRNWLRKPSSTLLAHGGTAQHNQHKHPTHFGFSGKDSKQFKECNGHLQTTIEALSVSHALRSMMVQPKIPQ